MEVQGTSEDVFPFWVIRNVQALVFPAVSVPVTVTVAVLDVLAVFVLRVNLTLQGFPDVSGVTAVTHADEQVAARVAACILTACNSVDPEVAILLTVTLSADIEPLLLTVTEQ